MRLQDYDTSNRYPAKVVSTERLTEESSDEVRELILDVAGDQEIFRVGQSIGVLAPGDASFGQEHHLRLYSVSDVPVPRPNGDTRVTIAVKRCFYVDEYNGERYPGRASNFLCDRGVGDTITVCGPYGLPFSVPHTRQATIFLIATSTGIAPFRAFVKHLFDELPDFEGNVKLFYGGTRGLDLVYLNDARDDFERYHDDDAFQAFKALSTRPHWTDEIDWSSALGDAGEQMWRLLESSRSYLYIAGLEKDHPGLMEALAEVAGGKEELDRRRAEMHAGGRWVELLY